MQIKLIACQQFAAVAQSHSRSTDAEVWQLAAGLEAVVILVLFLGWIASPRSQRSE